MPKSLSTLSFKDLYLLASIALFFLLDRLEVRANIESVTHDIRVNPDHVLVGPYKDIEVGHQKVGELFFQLAAQIFI